MLKISKIQLKQIIDSIIQTLEPKMIYLYGSYAYGQPTDESDIDLLVVVDNKQQDTIKMTTRAYIALQGLKLPVEINVVTMDTFEECKHWFVSVEKEATEKGKLLYAA